MSTSPQGKGRQRRNRAQRGLAPAARHGTVPERGIPHQGNSVHDDPEKLVEQNSTPVEQPDEGPVPEDAPAPAEPADSFPDAAALGLDDDEPIDLTQLRRVPDEEEIKAHIGAVFLDYGQRLLRLAAKQRRGDPEDLLDDAFVKALETPHKLAHLDPKQTYGFLSQVIVNLCRDQGKKDRRRQTDVVAPEVLEQHASAGDAYDRTVSRERALELLRVLPRVQAMCVMAHMGGWNMARTAERIGITHEDARYQMRQARRTVKKILSGEQIPVLLPPALVIPAGVRLTFVERHLDWAVEPAQAAGRLVKRLLGELWPDELKGRIVRVAGGVMLLALAAFAASFSSLYSYLRDGAPDRQTETRIVILPAPPAALAPAARERRATSPPGARPERAAPRRPPATPRSGTAPARAARPARRATAPRTPPPAPAPAAAASPPRPSPVVAAPPPPPPVYVANGPPPPPPVSPPSPPPPSPPPPAAAPVSPPPAASPPPIASPSSRYSRDAARCAAGPDC